MQLCIYVHTLGVAVLLVVPFLREACRLNRCVPAKGLPPSSAPAERMKGGRAWLPPPSSAPALSMKGGRAWLLSASATGYTFP